QYVPQLKAQVGVTGDIVWVEAVDNGMGMSQELLKTLFRGTRFTEKALSPSGIKKKEGYIGGNGNALQLVVPGLVENSLSDFPTRIIVETRNASGAFKREWTPQKKNSPVEMGERSEQGTKIRVEVDLSKGRRGPVKGVPDLRNAEWSPDMPELGIQGKTLVERPQMGSTATLSGTGSAEPAMKGGIDLTPSKMDLQTTGSGEGIKFNIDPAMLKELENAPGFVPVIMNIQPLESLPMFLGLKASEGTEERISRSSVSHPESGGWEALGSFRIVRVIHDGNRFFRNQGFRESLKWFFAEDRESRAG
ncbi:MAG: hypothetical protein HQL21_07315, partial [Candidatus Omnitrophica bacterium]|nr:hypothetical protein [Candidatus Omnitrophota bacterium]